MRFGSLFAGIGGFDLGLERAGMECAWQVEIDPYAQKILAKHWPHVRRWADIQTFPPDDGDGWFVDVVCGGPPCQPVSVAGKRKGSSDERWMWGEYLRVIATLCPGVFVAENPTGILSDDRGRTFGGIVAAVEAIGYQCEWKVISAADLGAPHRRERVWMVGRKNGSVGEMPVLRDVLVRDSPSSRARMRLSSARRVELRPVLMPDRMADASGSGLEGAVNQHSAKGLPGFRGGKGGDKAQDVPGEPASWWETESGVCRVAHGVPARVDRLRGLGNAVVPQVVEVIGRAIMRKEEIDHA